MALTSILSPGFGRASAAAAQTVVLPPKKRHTDHSGMMRGPFAGGPSVTRACLTCQPAAGQQMLHSEHFTWLGQAAMVPGRGGPGHETPQQIGKRNLLNNFCLTVESNWPRCTNCHAGCRWKGASLTRPGGTRFASCSSPPVPMHQRLRTARRSPHPPRRKSRPIRDARLWVNPTYLGSGILGWLLFGVEFLVGGYCPGTALVSMATLKADGLMFVVDVLGGIGVFGFTIAPLDNFWTHSGAHGTLTLFDWLGLSPPTVVVLAVLMALGMFAGGEYVERWMKWRQAAEAKP
jgi:hypothetical protein